MTTLNRDDQHGHFVMSLPPGLTCSRCHLPYDGALARRTYKGYVHARECATPTDLRGGAWVLVKGVMRWQREDEAAVA